jgi:hypothetical protein
MPDSTGAARILDRKTRTERRSGLEKPASTSKIGLGRDGDLGMPDGYDQAYRS